MKKVLILIETGFEEVEALTPVDLLRRAGAEVVLATSVSNCQVTGRNEITVLCDAAYETVDPGEFDMVVIPGGNGGVDALSKNSFALDLIREYFAQKKWVGAICAGPLVLKEAGVLNWQSITSYPSTKSELTAITNYSDERVVTDGHLITSRGPGTSVEFGLTLVEKLFGPEKATEIQRQIVA
ncbi:MAG: DJ-1 family glyoxalase III [Leptospirales bacterium]